MSIESNKHILFITPGFPANEQDTQCIPALWIYARELAESGCTVSVIALQYPFTSEAYQWHGISVYPLNGANKKWKQAFLPKKTIICARKIHKANPVQVIHVFWLHRATEIAEKVAKTLEIPLVATVMGQEMRNPIRRFNRWKNARFPIVSISEFQSQELKKEGVIASDIIPWGVVSTISREKDIDLIYVGSLITLKNVEYFVELCAQINDDEHTYQSVIVGDGPKRDELDKQIKSIGKKVNIKFTGALPYEETQNWIARSKVLVHPSEFEGFGMTIIEAMATETHVLATPVGIAKNLEIPHLIGEVQLDVAMLKMLLKSERPQATEFKIADTVQAYLAIYESVSGGNQFLQ